MTFSMRMRAKREYRTAGSPAPAPVVEFHARWYGKLTLLILSVGLLTLALAPVGQFYLAWVGLVPWLYVLRGVRSQKAAFLWSWLGGTLFFIANMWWMAYVNVPGTIALVAYCGIYWGTAAFLMRGAGLVDLEKPLWGIGPAGRVLLLAAIWVSLEWVRGILFTGLPWLYLGHTQTPNLAMCQIADALGVYGVSFWIVCINALIALCLFERLSLRRLRPAVGMVLVMVIGVLGYGLFRRGQLARCTRPGPMVMVVQPNYPQDNKNGDKGASAQVVEEFHRRATDAGLRQSPEPVDLVVWSETTMGPLNSEALEQLKKLELGYPPGSEGRERFAQFQQGFPMISHLAATYHTSILAGGLYWRDWRIQPNGAERFTDKRNSAYLFGPTGQVSPERYDKIHLVPFGEFIPFKQSIPMLYNLFLEMSPYDYDYTLTGGTENELTVFTLEEDAGRKSARPARFVVPICFEDIDSTLVARMFRPGEVRGKRADFIVNLTNDGWFKANEPAQHLQAAVFRSIENRAPMARSVNTGISAFIDSYGRVIGAIPKGREGTLSQPLTLDNRLTLYTRFGDVFAGLCVAATALLAAALIVRRRKKILAAERDRVER